MSSIISDIFYNPNNQVMLGNYLQLNTNTKNNKHNNNNRDNNYNVSNDNVNDNGDTGRLLSR